MSCPAWCVDPDCSLSYGAHPWSFAISAKALPTRGAEVAAIDAKEQRWERDMPAYKALRADGLQPRRIDGCGDLQARAETETEVAYGKPISKKHHSQVNDLLAS